MFASESLAITQINFDFKATIVVPKLVDVATDYSLRDLSSGVVHYEMYKLQKYNIHMGKAEKNELVSVILKIKKLRSINKFDI